MSLTVSHCLPYQRLSVSLRIGPLKHSLAFCLIWALMSAKSYYRDQRQTRVDTELADRFPKRAIRVVTKRWSVRGPECIIFQTRRLLKLNQRIIYFMLLAHRACFAQCVSWLSSMHPWINSHTAEHLWGYITICIQHMQSVPEHDALHPLWSLWWNVQ